MRILGFATIAAGLTLVAPAAAVAGDSAADQQRWTHVPHAQLKAPSGHHRHRWGHRIRGRWHAGWFAPGGWRGYRVVVPGYRLPAYWIAPRYVIAYRPYGLPAPQPGYAWSRYYDDAVLIDREGRVIDRRGDIQWDRYEGGYDDRDYPDPRHAPPPPAYEGTWEGTWTGEYDDGRPYSYSGSFDGEYRPAGAPYPPPHEGGPPPHAPGHNPAIIHQGSQVIINGVAYPAGGTVANGYYYPPATTTTVTVHAGCCPHAEPAATWKPKKKHWKPKPKSKVIRMTK
ncbi:hypothetical protein D1610_03465 [Sphingomonas gilva]|uniref:RcnB family protein n=1 Tax=Sphingomonas gilva TaxID=2305907 RepID=A0A396RRN0_9SPHN|nr:RcnB family protein [Sphingomonas gilva]RHW19180.1 hypothetical protein D1610_03465 [Sphingomonas gilva]